MNDRQRFLDIMQFKSVDRVPHYELGVWGQTIDRWYAEGMPGDVAYWNWFEGEPFFKIERRGFAHINVGMLPTFDYEVLQEDERYVIARHSNGIVTKALKEGTVRGTRASMDTYIDFPVKDRASWAEIKKRYNPSAPARYPLWWSMMAGYWKQREFPVCLLGNGTAGMYSQLRSWVGTENVSYLFFDDPALVHEMVEFYTEFVVRVTEQARCDVPFDYFNFFEDFAGKGGPLVSPDLFRTFLMPGYRRIISEFRKSGIKYFWLDSDGDPRALIPLMIEAGITCLWPLEVASDMDPSAIRTQYGKDLVLAGGIDKRELTKGRTEIDAELERRIPRMLEQGGFIPHLDHGFPPDISYANFQYYTERKMRLLGY